MLVEAVMTRSVVTAEPTCRIQSAVALLHKGRFRHLPVVRDGRLVGIVSDRDLANQGDRTLADVIHTRVITAAPETPVEVAASLMADNKIGALPVVDPVSETLAGIVSQTDLFVVLAHLLRGEGPSTRVELQLHDLPGELALVTLMARQHHVSITSLVTIPRETDSGPYTVVLRIGTMVPRPFIEALRQAGIEIADLVKA